ncbi:uncharacterized protein LOC133202125 [Saccostrea echinata]|uniref:uncharacterized protein LOC133202125 n=1 Tax=Saccostrea echinata TaxID=191078 RepID=UPI002A7EDD32|nr:uncharacterized protein LOC133202125 [Saccostrea echinata]
MGRSTYIWAPLIFSLLIIEGEGYLIQSNPKCRPFCRLPKETDESCSGLRFIFSCISNVWLRCTYAGELHCSCEWWHAINNVEMPVKDLETVKKSTIFETCLSNLKTDCEIWKNKWNHIPCAKITKQENPTDPNNPQLQLKLSEIRAAIMRIQDEAKRRQLLMNLHALVQRKAWSQKSIDDRFITTASTPVPQGNTTSKTSVIQRKAAPHITSQEKKDSTLNYTVIDWMDTIDGWHKKIMFEHWERVSEADIMETLRRRRMFLLIFGILLGCTIFVIVMLFTIKYQSDKNVRKDIRFDGDLDAMGRKPEESLSFLDKIRRNRKQKEKDENRQRFYQMSSLVLYPEKSTKPKKEYRRKPHISKSSSNLQIESKDNFNQDSVDLVSKSHDPVTVDLKQSSSSLDLGDRLFPSAMMRSFGAEINSPSPTKKSTSIETPKNTTEPSTSATVCSTSPAEIIPVNEVKTIKVATKSVTSSSDSSTSSTTTSSS